MKLITFRLGHQGEDKSRLGLILPNKNRVLVLDLGKYTGQDKMMMDMIAFLRGGDQARVKVQEILDSLLQDQTSEALEDLEKSEVVLPFDRVELDPPLPSPGKMICAGMNYADHVSEEDTETPAAPEFPMGFIKVSTSLVGDGRPVRIPKHSYQIDYEVELAIIMGERCKDIKIEEAYDSVAGYCVFNDVSARDIQFPEMKKGLLLMGKNFDTFGPMGPWLVTKDEVSDPQDLALHLKVNGEIRQLSNTRHMIFSIPELIAYWSRMTLEPGDVIATGTPSGVAAFREPDPSEYYLKPGDMVEAWVEEVGTLKNPILGS